MGHVAIDCKRHSQCGVAIREPGEGSPNGHSIGWRIEMQCDVNQISAAARVELRCCEHRLLGTRERQLCRGRRRRGIGAVERQGRFDAPRLLAEQRKAQHVDRRQVAPELASHLGTDLQRQQRGAADRQKTRVPMDG